MKPTRIYPGRAPSRRHHLAEWLEERQLDPMEFLNALNESASMDQPVIDKSQVYRWLKGQLPHAPTLLRVAAVLDLRDIDTMDLNPNLIFRHPDEVWIANQIKGRPEEEVRRLRAMIELALPRKTGTDN